MSTPDASTDRGSGRREQRSEEGSAPAAPDESLDPRGESAEVARRAGRGARGLAVRYGLGFLLNLAGLAVVAPALGQSALGTRFMIPLLVIYGFDVCSKGVWGTLIQVRETPDVHLLRTGFTLQLLLSALLSFLAIVVVSPVLVREYRDPVLRWMIPVACVGGLWTSLRWHATAVAERSLRYREVGIAELIELFGFNAILIAFTSAGAALAGVAVAMGTRGLPASLYLGSRFSTGIGFELDRRAVDVHRKFGLPFLGTSVLTFLPVYAAPTAASLVLPPEQAPLILSILALAYRLLELPRVLVTIAYRLGLAVQSRLSADTASFDRSLRTGLRGLMLILTPGLTALALLAPWYVPRVFGPGFELVADVMPWLAVPFIANAAWLYLAAAVSAEGRPGWSLRYYIAFNVVFWSALVPLMRWSATLGLPLTETVAATCGLQLLRSLSARSEGSLRAGDVIEPLLVAALTIVGARSLAPLTSPVTSALIALTAMAAYWIARYRSLGAELVGSLLELRGSRPS